MMSYMEETQSLEDQEILEKLTKVEDKLNKLKEFTTKLEKMRNARMKMIKSLENSSERKTLPGSKSETKRVQFIEEDVFRKRENEPRKSTISTKTKKSNSLYSLITNLKTWHGEVNHMDSEIEMLKTKSVAVTESEKMLLYREKLKSLETEKDEISNNILQFILKNMSEGKEEYQDFILQLEEENKEMEDKIWALSDQVKYLRENNRALMIENDNLRMNKTGAMKNLSDENLEMEFRKSIVCGKYSTMLPEANLLYMHNLQTSPSVQVILDLELEERLSLDERSVDSFTLDNQMTYWKWDEESMKKNLKKLELEHHEMEVIHMKLNLVKRYVRKHGVKQINKDTFLDMIDNNDATSRP